MKARVILGLTIILPLLLALTSCQERGYQKVQLRTRPVRPFYPLALKKAQQWKPDAYLDSISVDALPRDDYSRPILLFFGFESPSDDRHSLLIIFQNDVDEPKVEHVYHEVAISARNPINIEDWSLDSTDVLAIAQDNGGD